jgi:DNA-binding transcriptional ArsR family regulator
MPDLVDDIRRQIDARIAELRPLVEEAASLNAALAALDRGVPTPGRASRRVTPRSAGSSGGGQGRRRRRRGETRELLLAHLRTHPGSTAGDVAKALGLKRSSVGTRLTQLAKSGQVTKAERGYSAR